MIDAKAAVLAENYRAIRKINIKTIAAIILAAYLLIPLIRAAMSSVIITGVIVLLCVAGASLAWSMEGSIGMLAVAMLFLWRAVPNFFTNLSAVWWQHDPLACVWDRCGDGRVYVIFAAQILTIAAMIISHFGRPRAVTIAKMSDDEYNLTVVELRKNYTMWYVAPLFLALSIYVLITGNGSLTLYIATPFLFLGGLIHLILLVYITYVLLTARRFRAAKF